MSVLITLDSAVYGSLPVTIKGPKGPEPALGFFEKKPPGLSHFGRDEQHYNKSFRPTSPGVARTFFSFYVIIITSTLRFRLRYVTVAGVRFSFTLRYRSGREAHRGSRLRTLAVTSQCRILIRAVPGEIYIRL
jgi:hypothetical protein